MAIAEKNLAHAYTCLSVLMATFNYRARATSVPARLKGTFGRKRSLAQMKEREKCKKRAITDLNAPNGSRDIPFQSQEFEQYGRRHFVDF